MGEKTQDEVQLYTLLRQLYDLVDHGDQVQLGQLIGFSVINSLISFSTTGVSSEEFSSKETQAIHRGLERTIETCEREGVSLPSKRIRDGVVRYLELFTKGRDYSGSNELLALTIKSLHGRPNFEHRIIGKGMNLYEGVLERGSLKGLTNILNGDYEAIEQFFIREM